MIQLYGVIKENKRRVFSNAGMGGSQVFTVPHQDLSIVVSFAPIDFSQKIPQETLMKIFLDYQTSLENIMKEYDIIPFKFGTCLNSKEEALTLLEGRYAAFQELVLQFSDLCEFSVTAVWVDQKEILESLITEDNSLAELKQKAQGSPNPKDKVEIGKKLHEALIFKNGKISEMILQDLSRVTLKNAPHEKLDDFMAFHASFLLPKIGMQRFYDQLEKLNESFSHKAQFRVVGPLPPYSFATVCVSIIPKRDLEKAQHTLGVDDPSSFDAIQKAHQRLVALFHPDRGSEHIKKFEEVREAYKLLARCHKEDKSFSFKKDFLGIEVKNV